MIQDMFWNLCFHVDNGVPRISPQHKSTDLFWDKYCTILTSFMKMMYRFLINTRNSVINAKTKVSKHTLVWFLWQFHSWIRVLPNNGTWKRWGLKPYPWYCCGELLAEMKMHFWWRKILLWIFVLFFNILKVLNNVMSVWKKNYKTTFLQQSKIFNLS